MTYWLAAIEKYAVFSGRARRREYWYFVLFNVLLGFAWGFFSGLFGALGGASRVTIQIIAGLFSLFTLLPAVAVAVRRLHDTGRSGWWFLLSFVPVAGTIVMLIFLISEGQPGDNDYGPDPRASALTPSA